MRKLVVSLLDSQNYEMRYFRGDLTPNRSVPRYGSIGGALGGGLESFIEHKPVILVDPNAETSVAVQ